MKSVLYIISFLAIPLFGSDACCPELTMEDMWQCVIDNHEDIKRVNLENYQAGLTVKQTLRRFYPNVGATASLIYSNPTEAVDGERLIPTSFRSYGLTVSQPLFDMRFKPALRSAKCLELATANLNQFQIYEILYLASEVYLGLLQSKALLDVTQNQVDLLKKQYCVTKERYERGEVPVTDLLRSEEGVKRAQRIVHDVMSDLNIYEENLSNFIGDDASIYTLSSTFYMHWNEGESIDDLVAEARTRRHDLKGAFAAVEAAKLRVKTEKRNNWPKLDFLGEYVLASPETLAFRNNSWSAGLWLTMPLLDSGRNYLSVQNAKTEVDKLELAATRLYKDIQVQVKSAYYELESAQANFCLLEKELEIAEENYCILSERYERGQTSNIDLLDALHAYIQAEANYTSAHYNLILLQIKLKKATGLFDELLNGRKC